GLFGAIAGIILAAYLIVVVYFLFEGLTGYTLGKLILGIRIANDDGTAAGVGKLLYRYLLKNSGSFLALVALFTGVHALATLGNLAGLLIFVGCFFTLGMKRQAFHDMIAKTAVYPKGAIK
ncbi:MAG TPA: RDD family protein, partial [Gemmatimonadales bacterium]|nr:RDD family protein [Gemmatimonadales bacterium]